MKMISTMNIHKRYPQGKDNSKLRTTSMITKQIISTTVLTLLFLISCKKEVSLSSVNKPIYYTWEIHIHNIVAPNESVAFNNICEGLRRTARIFENHNIKVNWGVMQNFAEAVVKYQTSEDNIFIELENMGHEIGGHSLGYYEDPSEILINRLGFTPKYFNLGVATVNNFKEQLKLIQNVFLSHNYKIMSDSYSWLSNSPGFDKLTYIWQPSFDPAVGNLFTSDPNNEVIAINIQGNGWQGGRDIDIVNEGNFEILKVLLIKFIENSKNGKINVFPIGSHFDVFTTGPLMQEVVATINSLELSRADPAVIRNYMQNSLRNNYDFKDIDFSESAISALDNYLTEVIDPLMQKGIIISKTYSEIYEIYFCNK